MAESNLLRNVRRRSITSSKFLQNMTMEDLEKQAMLIAKTRAEEAKQEEKDENKNPSNSAPDQRGVMTRRLSGLARSLSNSLTTTRGTLQRTFSMSSQNMSKLADSEANAPPPLTREQDKTYRQALHTRTLAAITTTIEPVDLTARLVTLHMSPDFPSYMFDGLLSVRILESIATILSPGTVPMNPFAAPIKVQAVGHAFKDARKESEEHTLRLWTHLCRSRAGKGEKEPCFDIRTKIVSLGIMAILWPRGVIELGFKDHVWGKCEADSWGFNFCRRPGKDTLGCGLFMFLRGLGMWDEERSQPRPGDLRQNGIEVKDFAFTTRSILR